MNQTEFEALVFGTTGGLVVGSWLGYKVAKIVERVRDRKLLRDYEPYAKAKRRKSTPLSAAQSVNVDDGDMWTPLKKQASAQASAARKPAKVIPITTHRQVMNDADAYTAKPSDNGRDEVIDALVGAGFKKAASAAAADACTAIEKAASAELWIVAALRHAASGK